MKRQLFLIVGLFTAVFSIKAQTPLQKQKILKETNVQALLVMQQEFSSRYMREKARALQMAREKGWPVKIERNGRLMELQRVSPEGYPVYYTTYNVDAARSTRANTLHNGGLLNLNIEGQNMTAHIWDGGLARTTHQEYDGPGGNNRFSIGDGTNALHYHSAHVTGTIIASGVNADAKGMCPQASAVGYDWDNDVAEATGAAANDAMLISNHSYGYVASNIPDAWFGQYGQDAHDWDDLMYNSPYYLMVVAAGNDGNDDNSNGDPLDGESAYDKLSGHATAKNNMVVANAQDANIDANGNLVNVTINSSSSEGPTDDYRIKPDITGNGTQVFSTVEDADDAYNTLTGTSMASPNVAGTLLLLQQYYNDLNGNFMRAATLKGLALHTADDVGPQGPDAVYGWGLLNAKKAAETIAGEGSNAILDERILADGGSYTIDVVADGNQPLIASISWTDPAGNVNNNTNDHTAALVNDLDIRITRNGNTYYPYKLISVQNNGLGDNTVDPYEKIIIQNTNAGDVYTITVNHKGNLAANQNYSLIVTGIVVPTDNPSVVTGDITSITTDSAIAEGNVVDEGASAVTERGIVWSLNPNPTVNDNKIVDPNTGTGSYTADITGLNSNTTYYVRAYAINAHGTSYGDNKMFTTLCGIIDNFPFTEGFEGGNLPDCWSNEYVTNAQDWDYTDGGHNGHPANAHSGNYNALFYHGSTAANVTKLVTPPFDFSNVTSATLKFWHVQQEWSPDQDELRIYYKTSSTANWTLLEEYTDEVADWTERVINLPNLSSEYYIAFEATGQYGYGVGLDDVEISVQINNVLPSVTTGTVSGITSDAAVAEGNVTDEGSSAVTERGICWSTSQNPTTADAHASNGSGAGNYSVNLTGLTPNTTYYVRAYATNATGTAYGSNESFSTQPDPNGGYCVASGNMNEDTAINSVKIVKNNNVNVIPLDHADNGKTAGYADYTAVNGILKLWNEYKLSVKVNTGGNRTVKAKAWIDWNQDKDFNDVDEEIDLGEATNVTDGITSIEAVFRVKNYVLLGKTRLRIAVKYDDYPAACENNFDGEVEDYTLVITRKCNKAAFWDGQSWTDENDNVVNNLGTSFLFIDENFVTNGNPVTACGMQVAVTKQVRVTTGDYLKIKKDIVNFGEIYVENDAVLVQSNNSALITGNGVYQIDRTSQNMDEQYDYGFWSSPVQNFKLGGIVSNAWGYYSFDPIIQHWKAETANTMMENGKGYAVSAPVNHTNGAIAVSFVNGNVPFNTGNIVVPLTVNGTGAQDNDDWNFIGNPYPSTIDFDALANDNTNIQGSYHLWTNCAGLDANGQHQYDGFIVYTVGSGATSACNGNGPSSGQYISVAQGFAVEANTAGDLIFKNDHRVTDNVSFVNRPSGDKNRFWLDFTANNGFNQILVGFFDGATDQKDRLYDAHALDTSDFALYSLIGNEKFSIQGLAQWDDTERIIPLGYTTNIAGDHQIALNRFEGVFDAGVNIYLKDLSDNSLHDLKTAPYVFTSAAGTYDNRFLLIVNGTAMNVENQPEISRINWTSNEGVYQIISNDENLQKIEAYNLQGKKLSEKIMTKPAKIMTLDLSHVAPQVLVFKLWLSDGQIRVIKVLR